MHAHWHTRTPYQHTLNTQWQMNIITSTWSGARYPDPPPFKLSVSVTTKGLYSGIPYTTTAKKCSLEKLYHKWKHNHSSPTISLLPCCSHTLSFPPSLSFSTPFPIPCFLGSAADGVAQQKTLSFCAVLTYSITQACGNSEVYITVVLLC